MSSAFGPVPTATFLHLSSSKRHSAQLANNANKFNLRVPKTIVSRPCRRLVTTVTADLNGRVFLVTGSTDGIGKHTARKLAQQNATVLIHGRDPERGGKTLRELKSQSGNDKIEYFNSDFSSLAQIHQLSSEIHAKYSRIDCLINNAGVYETRPRVSEDGFELTWAVNVIAPFLLTRLLLDLLRAGSAARVINVSSVSQSEGGGVLEFDNLQHQKGYEAHSAYGLSKLAMVCFTYDLAERLRPLDITANCLDPGTVNTKMLLAGWGRIGIPLDKADNEFYLATDPTLSEVTGKYFVGRRECSSCRVTYDKDKRDALWDVLEEHSGIDYSDVLP